MNYMKLFDQYDRRLFLFFALFMAAGLFLAWLLTDNRRSDPLEVQNKTYRSITEGIGGNEQPIQQQRYNARFICPVDPSFNRYLTSEFGVRYSPNDGRLQFHPGIDMTGGPRAQIKATDAGEVWEIGRNRIDGLYVVIFHKGGYRSKYCHLSTVYTMKGEIVETGQVIGRMGSTGRTTGEHLHFEVWQFGSPVDPAELLKITKNEEGGF